MRLRFWKGFLVAGLTLLYSSAASAASVRVTGDVVNLRSGPGTSNARIGQVVEGTRLEVLGSQDGWYQVKTSSGQTAWIYGEFVAPDFEDMSDQLAVAEPTTDVLNIRSGPSTDYSIIGKAYDGNLYPVLGRQGTWLKVSMAGGGEGWMSANYSKVRTLEAHDFAVPETGKGVVALAPSVPVRRQPRKDFGGMVNVKAGTQMAYLESRDGWHKVRTSDGVVGWVESGPTKIYNLVDYERSVNYILMDGSWEIWEPDIGVITANQTNLRTGPGTNYKSIAKLPAGTRFKAVDTRAGFYQIATEGGQSGWVHKSLAKLKVTPQVASVKVVQSSPQKKVLSIRGSFPQPIIKEFGGGSHLAVYLGGVEANPAFLQLNSKELGTVSVRDTGVLVSFNEKPRYTVVKNAPGEVQIQFEASLDGATLGQSGDRQVLTFQTSGFADPDAYFDGATGLVNLALPNTALKGEIRGLSNSTVRSVSARQDGNQVRVTVDSAVKGRFLMRRGPNKVALEFLPAGVKGKTIVLDAGHGGRDPGAGGPAGLKEKDVNLSIALKLKPLLEKAGAKVVMTRTGDTEGAPASELDKLTAGERIVEDLHSRAELANRSGADLFLSIHNNSDPSGGQSGTTTYWTDVNFNADRSRALALSLQGEMVKALGRKDNGIKSNDFYVIRNSLAPAALAEVLFVSDPAEEGLLKQGATQDKIAQALYQGLVKFYQ